MHCLCKVIDVAVKENQQSCHTKWIQKLILKQTSSNKIKKIFPDCPVQSKQICITRNIHRHNRKINKQPYKNEQGFFLKKLCQLKLRIYYTGFPWKELPCVKYIVCVSLSCIQFIFNVFITILTIFSFQYSLKISVILWFHDYSRKSSEFFSN